MTGIYTHKRVDSVIEILPSNGLSVCLTQSELIEGQKKKKDYSVSSFFMEQWLY